MLSSFLFFKFMGFYLMKLLVGMFPYINLFLQILIFYLVDPGLDIKKMSYLFICHRLRVDQIFKFDKSSIIPPTLVIAEIMLLGKLSNDFFFFLLHHVFSLSHFLLNLINR